MGIDTTGRLWEMNHGILHTPRFTGHIWFVDGAVAASGDGTTPHQAIKTIAEAVVAASAGDAITVKAGTYTEEGLDMNLNSLELWPEIGVILDPANGTALTISGNFCKVWCPGGSMFITPGANDTGVQITGQSCYVSDVRVKCASVADIGFHIGDAADNTHGDGAVLDNCRCSSPLITAFKIQANMVKLDDCCTGGDAGDSSIGFWMTPDASGNIDKTRLKNCGSQGHETSGYQVDAGCTNGVIEECYSGGGDGRWSDPNNAFVWADFAFDDRVYATSTFTNIGPASINLFRIYSSVLITEFSGDVKTVLAADVGNAYIELWDGANTIDVTDSPGPSFNSLPVESFLHKIDDNTVQIAIENSSQVRLYEDATRFGEDPNFQITAKDGAATYIRLVYSGAGASGAIHWHIQWTPITETGFVTGA